MVWPASVITRSISFGKAVILETGADLSLRVTTRASRSLVSIAEGFRMETMSASFETAEAGEEILFPLPVTNQPGWADAATRMAILVGPDEHSHLYTTTLTIYSGQTLVRTYNVGPYPVPQGAGVLDGDTMLIPDETQPGVLVTIPEAWQLIIDSANAASTPAGSTAGQVLTSTGPTTEPVWAASTGTTYAAISQANAENPVSTTVGLATGQRLAQAVAANELVRGVLNYDEVPPDAGIWLRRPAP